MTVHNVLFEDEAKQRHCILIGRNCLGGGCMSWRTHVDMPQVASVPWPEVVPKPLDLGSAQPLKLSAEMRASLNSILRGTQFGEGRKIRITRVVPDDHLAVPNEVSVLVEFVDSRGYCMELSK
jgi:hypothetical protein